MFNYLEACPSNLRLHETTQVFLVSPQQQIFPLFLGLYIFYEPFKINKTTTITTIKDLS